MLASGNARGVSRTKGKSNFIEQEGLKTTEHLFIYGHSVATAGFGSVYSLGNVVNFAIDD